MTMRIAFRFDTGFDFRLLIARVTGAPVHCCTVYPDDMCSDVAFSGMRLIPLRDRVRVGEWRIIEAPLNYNHTLARQLAVQRIGWKYDWFGALVSWWLGRPGKQGASGKLFCSESCADELRAAGVPLMYARTAAYTPRKLYDELRDYHGWRYVD